MNCCSFVTLNEKRMTLRRTADKFMNNDEQIVRMIHLGESCD